MGQQAREAARLHQILDAAVEHAIIEINLDRTVRGWNVGAERLFGWSAQEVLGQAADLIFTSEDREADVPAREAAQALSQGRAEDTRYHLRRDGSRFWASGVMTPLTSPGGEPDGLLKIVRDQTGTRVAEEALLRALEVAHKATEARARLMAVAGHDLRQPLQVIGMVLEQVAPQVTGERNTRYLAYAQEALGRLAGVQMRHASLVKTVQAALSASGLPAGRLELEITESVLLDGGERVHEVLRSLRDLGMHVALDDFGTGYSSLSYLRLFPFDKIKIDRSFITGLDDPGTAAIVQAIVDLGTRLGMAVTAEGIETSEQWTRVRAMGCTLAQGYLLGRPQPLEAALAAAPGVAEDFEVREPDLGIRNA